MKTYNIAVVGADGLVGREIVRILKERKFPVARLLPLDSPLQAAGNTGGNLQESAQLNSVRVLLDEIDIAFFTAGPKVSTRLAPEAVESGCLVIDNSAAFRLHPEVPLVVPEVNAQLLSTHQGIIANPTCTVTPLVLTLKPLADRAGIKRVVVSTYQSVSGLGDQGLQNLTEDTQRVLEGKAGPTDSHSPQIAFNAVPQIGAFHETGYSEGELRLVLETQKIMGDANLALTVTTVRVPVYRGHSEAVNIETVGPLTPDEARSILQQAPGITVVDDPRRLRYPMPALATDRDEVLVGRIRRDFTVRHGLDLWISADNIRKGAALNAVQIAESLVAHGLI